MGLPTSVCLTLCLRPLRSSRRLFVISLGHVAVTNSVKDLGLASPAPRGPRDTTICARPLSPRYSGVIRLIRAEHGSADSPEPLGP